MLDKLFVDLHVHTTYSDGSLTPEEVVTIAQKKKLVAIGIADHDTTDGILPALKEGAKRGVEVIPAVELSAEIEGSSEEAHILGYFIDWEDSEFQQQLAVFRKTRENRALEMADRLSRIGIELDRNTLLNKVSTTSIGRLHFAKAMVKQGYAKDIYEAFGKYLIAGKPAYVPKYRLTPENAIKMITDVGGIPVLAHPYFGSHVNREFIGKLAESGLLGIEVWHSKHSQNVTENFTRLAYELGLLITGGSDCHGPFGDQPSLVGTLNIPFSILVELKKRKTSIDKEKKSH